jgi:hypothetical protein
MDPCPQLAAGTEPPQFIAGTEQQSGTDGWVALRGSWNGWYTDSQEDFYVDTDQWMSLRIQDHSYQSGYYTVRVCAAAFCRPGFEQYGTFATVWSYWVGPVRTDSGVPWKGSTLIFYPSSGQRNYRVIIDWTSGASTEEGDQVDPTYHLTVYTNGNPPKSER